MYYVTGQDMFVLRFESTVFRSGSGCLEVCLCHVHASLSVFVIIVSSGYVVSRSGYSRGENFTWWLQFD